MMDGASFAYSGLPNYLEWYKCYNDPAVATWIDGMELYRERENWDQKSIDRWNFLYRPFHPAVGRPQKKQIRELRTANSTCKANIQQAQESLAALAQDRRQQKRRALVTAIFGSLACAGFWFYTKSLPAAAFAILITVIFLSRVFAAWGENRSNVGALDENISQNQEIVRRNEEGISRLEEEIQQLVRRIPQAFDGATVAGWLEDDLCQLELTYLSELLNESVDHEKASRHFRRRFSNPNFLGIPIKSWGFLQPSVQKGPMGKESTGRARAYEQLGDRIESWQTDPKLGPFFRLWYVQFVWPLARNLNICSFFYDFVTRRSYGHRWEVIQYNHVSTFSIREIDPELEDWADGKSPWKGSKAKSPNALTIATSSGVHFRCVLVDDDLAEYFNEHLKCEEKIKELYEESQNTSNDIDGSARLRTEISEWMEKQRNIELGTAINSRSILGEIRQSVEDYVARTEQANRGFG